MTTTSNENILMMFEEINEKLDRTQPPKSTKIN